MSVAKLTIEADEAVLRRAEEAAAAQQTTLPDVLRQVVEHMAVAGSFDESKLPPITRSALGLVKALPDRPYKELLEEAIIERYENTK